MANDSEYLNTFQAAQYIGVSDRTIRNLCADRKIKHERINNRNIRFKKEWLDDYLKSIVQVVEPITETKEDFEQ